MIKTPFLTVDGIVELYDENETYQGIVLIERLNRPLGMAIPGGFVDIGERVETAVVREMKEEISLDVEIKSMLGVYSDPKRDERFHTVSIVYICKAFGKPIADDDAKEVYIFKDNEIPLEKLVFDHRKIVEDYLNSKK